jgi:hypothetical protein
MTGKVSGYVTPKIVSFSESELLDVLGPSCVYPEAIPTSDPSTTGGGGTSGSTADPKTRRR